MDLGLKDAAVVVAGGTSGMGRAAAECFAVDGARVAGRRWGHINALVNAAGPMAGGLKSFETYTDADWHQVLDGLTLGAVRTIRAALPYMRAAEWARIVNVSAMSTKRQSPALIAYTASKAALTSLSKNLSMIGPVIAFAASARNTYMTGANITVDGGSDFT